MIESYVIKFKFLNILLYEYVYFQSFRMRPYGFFSESIWHSCTVPNMPSSTLLVFIFKNNATICWNDHVYYFHITINIHYRFSAKFVNSSRHAILKKIKTLEFFFLI